MAVKDHAVCTMLSCSVSLFSCNSDF